MKYLLCLSLMWINIACAALPFSKTASYDVCFTPGEECTDTIVANLNQARHDIWVQAYSFTSKPIAQALLAATHRGVKVQVILDKSQRSQAYSAAQFLYNQGIPTWIDDRVAIAHNKVMIIDQTTVITGSFNFTQAAQKSNAENVLIIHDAMLAQRYLQNWQNRWQASIVYQGNQTPLLAHHPSKRGHKQYPFL